MLKSLVFLAAAAKSVDPFEKTLPGNLERSSVSFGHSAREVLLIVGLALLLGAVLFVWVYLSRKARRDRRTLVRSSPMFHSERHSSVGRSGRRRRRKRRGVDDHLPRNPTLSEVGGLPPPRPDEPPVDPAAPGSPQPQS